ncbi:MAG: rhomboid family intramembrane serine protease [Candidatus Omnitrophica bacterium]|nr:rhomboid family intramembrane serine protease [Candidatus Omnitrophota bacterium]
MIPLKDDNPTKTFPIITILLIITNIAVFLYELSLGEGVNYLVGTMGAVPYEVTHIYLNPQVPLTLITSLFLHGGILHLLGNMLYLWIFGNNIEDAVGHIKFILFYLITGITASMTHILLNPDSMVPVIGASGAISGVMGAYFLLYPRAKVLTLIPFFIFIRIIKVPAFFFLGFWMLFQVISGINVSQSGEAGIAWFAHIGGFAAGLILAPIFRK